MPDVESRVSEWLSVAGFRPAVVQLPNDVKAWLLRVDDVEKKAEDGTETSSDLATEHAIDILRSVPRYERERRHALETARYVVRFDDGAHGSVVWGLVCIDAPTVTVRWRHRTARSLERATEELVDKVWANSGVEAIFEPFTIGHNIPVREPLVTADAYVGEVLPPGPSLAARAAIDKGLELRLTRVAAWSTAVFIMIGLTLYLTSRPETVLRWLSGFFDRLATTAAATAVVSYLNYYFHLKALQRKPLIDWK